MKKKFALSFLTIASVALLAACGEVSTSGSNTTGNEIGKELKVGFNFEKTGEVAAYGSAEQKGAQLAVDEINAKGEMCIRDRSTGFDYTRTKNPTRATAEKTLAAIESADYALATSSGMSAIVLAFSIFPVGSKVLAVRDLYGGSFRWFNQQEQEGRFSFTYANTEEELIHHLDHDPVDVLYICLLYTSVVKEFSRIIRRPLLVFVMAVR